MSTFETSASHPVGRPRVRVEPEQSLLRMDAVTGDEEPASRVGLPLSYVLRPLHR